MRIGHDPANLPGGPERDDAAPDVVVVSTAILPNNPELIAAKERGLRHLAPRRRCSRTWARDLETLAVAGTHGKTTTSSMLASVLDAHGRGPHVPHRRHRARLRHERALRPGPARYVVEADESDKSFTHLSPRAVLVTNIEADHLDHYRDLDEIYEKFAAFIGSVPADGGVVVACGDDEALAALARAAGRSAGHLRLRRGLRRAHRVVRAAGRGQRLRAGASRRTPARRAHVKQNPGRHNVLNAAGVIVLADALGMDAEAAARAMAGFAGVRRRFDLVGEAAGITVVDDYAHHPTEIAATIGAASQLGFRHVHVLFQPHRYSRVPLFTEVLKDEFGRAFDAADTVTFMDVYPAGEAPGPGVSGKTFLNVVLDHAGHPEAALRAAPRGGRCRTWRRRPWRATWSSPWARAT